MTFNLSVCYQGQKKSYKGLSPSTLLQQLVTEVVRDFNLPQSTKCQLKFRQSTLDLSQPIRFSNLPNNAQLELITGISSNIGPCKIALSVIGSPGLSCIGTFPAQCTLIEMLQGFISEGKLPGDSIDRLSELILLRSSFSTLDVLSETTLSSLGLTGQSVRFQLKLRDEKGQSVHQGEENSSCETSNSATATLVPQGSDSNPQFEEKKSDRNFSGASPVSPIPTKLPGKSPSTFGDPMDVSDPTDPEHSPVPLASPKDAVGFLLSNNFDVVSRAAVVAMLKYLINIRSSPLEVKFRTIKMDNKVVKEKILPARGAVDVLCAAGFTKLSETLSFGDSADPVRLDEAISALEMAMDDLEVPNEDRPLIVPRKNIGRSAEFSNSPSHDNNSFTASFDPFKPLFMRQGVDEPPRETSREKPGMSSSEQQLEQLKRKRQELEGRPSDVERRTAVVLPHEREATAQAADLERLDSLQSDDSGHAIPRSVLQKLLKSQREEEEGRPLTTQVLRDLQKLRDEKVYRETIVRVRFPDKVQLVGHFHPRDTLREVYCWVFDQLLLEGDRLVDSCGGERSPQQQIVEAMSCFELFISPPKTVFTPAYLETANKRTVFQGWNECDLLSLGLVPAAILSLSWKKEPLAPSTASPGSYLKPLLLSSATAASSSSSSVASGLLAIPRGVNLVKSDGDSSQTASLAQTVAEGKTPALQGRKESKGPAKPKWFKL